MGDEETARRSPEERFYRIVEDGLCIGCGLCQSLAGADRIAMAVTPEGNQRPVVRGTLDEETVDRIYDVCPGTRIEGLPDHLVENDSGVDPVWGPFRRVVRAYAADPTVRFQAATGGVLSALAAFLLESGRVDFILHATASKNQPTFGERHLSFGGAGVMAGAGSRYGPTATLVDFNEILDRGQRFALVAKPCDVAAVRNLARLDERVARLCRYQLALVCGGFMEPKSLRAFLGQLGLDYEQLEALRYRGYGCPGPTRIETRDGQVIEKNYLDFWGEDESAWSLPFRCKVCPDGIGEAADIAASDTWPGGSPSWEGQKDDPGTNGVIARTRAGEELLQAAAEAGAIVIEREITLRDMDLYQPHQVTKKQTVWARHQGLKAAGKLAPVVHGLRIAELARAAGLKANLAQARGTRRRAREGRTSEPRPRPA